MMMINEDRWQQRLQNLNKAFQRLLSACSREDYDDLALAGLIQTYEFTFELSWKTLKDRLNYEGYEVTSPRETIKKAFEDGLLDDVDTWLNALQSRNLFSHSYDDIIATQALQLIKETYYPMLNACVIRLNLLASQS
ncbi:MAG: HI0074 family nucleotidyltransferase substrate-binding subunit [Akkermansia sp.]